MRVVLRDVPFKGKVIAIGEDTVDGSFGRLELRTKLVVKNESLGVKQSVAFKRPGGGKGEVLTTLIEDFKANKEIIIKGKVSYSFHNEMFMGDKDLRESFRQVNKLVGKDSSWKQSWSRKEKELLGDFLSRIIIPIFGAVFLEVLVDGKVKYSIWSGEKDYGGVKISLHKAVEEER